MLRSSTPIARMKHERPDQKRRPSSRTLRRVVFPLMLLSFALISVAHPSRSDSQTRARTPVALVQPQPPAASAASSSYTHADVAKRDMSTPSVSQQQRGDRPFRHPDHESVACLRCHSTETGHGTVLVRTRAQCMACHHAASQRAQCGACHDATRLASEIYVRAQTFRIAGAVRREATLTFVHAEHADISCAACHVQPVTLSASPVTCGSCHAEHHRAEGDCLRCHTVEPPESAHPRASHLTCAGAGCHEPQPFEGGLRTRQLCLSCHQGYGDHKPDGNCVDCHVLPPWHTPTIERSRGSP